MTELDTLSDVERVILRYAVLDNGRRIYTSMLGGKSVSNVGRYLTEGGELLPQRAWTFVWRCIVQLIGCEPHLLEGEPPTQRDLGRLRRLREESADLCLEDALRQFRAGDWDKALGAIDKAELVAPLYTPRGRTYDDLRGFVWTERVANANKRAATTGIGSVSLVKT